MEPSTRSAEHDPLEFVRQARACEAAGQYRQARKLYEEFLEQLDGSTRHNGLEPAIRLGLWRTSHLWWARLQHGGVILRRCAADDEAFFRRCFSDARFTQQFNRQRGFTGDLRKALQRSGHLSPLTTRLLMWVVESAASGAVGLASLSSIDTVNMRAELSVGFPGDVPPTLAVKATLMMLHFALVMMPFNKVYTYTYADNDRARHNTQRFGFVHEGRLEQHFRLPGQGYVSVDQFGLTRSQLHGHDGLKALARRRIGQQW